MTRRRLLLRSLRFHWRSHVGVVLGVAVAAAALVGALVVGDSVRGTLRQRALERLAGAGAALEGGDRFFTVALAQCFGDVLHPTNPAPMLPTTERERTVSPRTTPRLRTMR